MKINFLHVFAMGMRLVISSVPMSAHHSFAAEFDAHKPVTLAGTVRKVEWIKPHARFSMDVKDENGVVTNWELELGSPNGLLCHGWTRDSLKTGDAVTVHGSLARNGSKLANVRKVTLSDGTQVLGASSEDRRRLID